MGGGSVHLSSFRVSISVILPGLRAAEISCGGREGSRGEVGLVWRLAVKARMGALTIEKVEVPAQRSARFCDGVVGLEVDLLVLHRSPEPLDEHVVAPGALAVHADGDPVLLKDTGERLAGEPSRVCRRLFRLSH